MKISLRNNQGFTLIELITIILLLGVISVVATAKWPGDMQEDAAVREFKRAIRYAQHQAMTRNYDPANNHIWGITITPSDYTIERQDGIFIPDFKDRSILDDPSISISVTPLAITSLWFNGLGEPTDATGTPLTAPAIPGITYTVAGKQLTVCLQTGYVIESATCP